MDTFYNKSKAVQTLDKIIVERTAAAASLQMYILDSMVENSCHTYSMFSRYTPNTKLLPRPEFLAKYSVETNGGIDQHITITASNRFFTPIKQAGALEAVNINVEIDPQGLLAKVDQTRYVHTEDNIIDYYILTEGDNIDR
ncbi:hypothetical protein BDN71DRAFT_1436439 [Pleurotus eryngii]|uniref:Uncharacterized protein n=1 Tax=Pleurotus eryngii TaxID=5323 RepID=A0A9P6D9T3_PLEER|nr:hypothetical protein BDN71DRAFT_1436439 [Pleurotus eryngii]